MDVPVLRADDPIDLVLRRGLEGEPAKEQAVQRHAEGPDIYRLRDGRFLALGRREVQRARRGRGRG